MPNCAILSCKNYSRKVGRDNGNVSFHAFPRDPKYKGIWIDATGQKNWFPNQYSRICSIHFKEDSFTETKKFRRLSKTAIPTIDVLKTLTNSESIDQNTSNRPSLRNTRKRKFKKVIPSTSSRHPSLFSPKKIKLIHTMNPTQQGNKQNKIFSLASLLKCLTKKSFIIDEQANLLSNINVTINELYSRKTRDEEAEYSPEFWKFALTLHFYSNKGYNYLREVFNLSLPHPHTVETWYHSVNGKPGFTSESLKALKIRADNSKNPLYCCLMIGEMAIQKRVEYDGENTYGWEEFGAHLDTDEAPEAREALVFLVTGVNTNWAVPVGYFLVERTTSEQKANLVVQCLKNLHDSNIVVCGLSCDGYIPNLAMAKILGCKLEPNEQMNTTFEHPITKQPIAVFLNPCDMMKLVTMCLQSCGNIVDGNGKNVSWAHFELLNKLENRDIDFDDKKKIATILDKSHAKSLGFCGENLKSQDFKEPSATVEFMRTLNDLFDILTSRNFKEFGFKQPLNLDNKARIMQFFEKAEDYITKLRDPQGGLLFKNPRKAGLAGLLMCIKSTKVLFQTMIEEKRIKFLSMNRFGLNHLELFFCNIRAHSGCNDDPTCRQLVLSYKKMLRHVEIKNGKDGSFVQLEHISILDCSSAVQVINSTTTRASLSHDEADCGESNTGTHDLDKFCSTWSQLIEFGKENTTYYIAGYVVRALGRIIKCSECNNALSLPKPGIDHTFEFVTFNDECPVYPSKDAVQICRVAEFEIAQIVDPHEFRSKTSLAKLNLINKILRAFVGSNIFSNIDIHQFDQSPTENHLVHLIKAVANTYIDVRIHYLSNYGKPIMTKKQLLNKLFSFQWL